MDKSKLDAYKSLQLIGRISHTYLYQHTGPKYFENQSTNMANMKQKLLNSYKNISGFIDIQWCFNSFQSVS